MLKTRQLHYLVALADTLSFSRAAERCHVTQSTLCTGLKELEYGLGVQVAERTPHSVLMTPIGKAVAERARDVLTRLKDIEELAGREADGVTPLLRCGTIPTVGPFIMPRALPLIRQAFPHMKIFLREELTTDLLKGLVDGRLDLIVIALPHDLPPQIETQSLFEDGYQLVTPRQHPLANLRRAGGEDLRGRQLMLLEKGHCLQRHALSSFPQADLCEDESFAATSLPTLVAMVEEGLGLTLLPRLAVAAGAVKGHEVALTDIPDASPRQVVAAWRSSSSKGDLYRKVGDCLRRARDTLIGVAEKDTAAPL
jgi:LysR family hydrogen peroxide-inducible transcriptional activator